MRHKCTCIGLKQYVRIQKVLSDKTASGVHSPQLLAGGPKTISPVQAPDLDQTLHVNSINHEL